MILRVVSVSNPSAKINNHLQPGSTAAGQIKTIGEILEEKKGIFGNYYYLFVLLHASGARFQEVCNIKKDEIADDGQVLIKGLKRSHDRIISDVRATRFLLKCRTNGINPFNGCNIFTASRLLKSNGILKMKKGRKKLTVTGVFRDEYAKNIRSIQRESSTLTKSIGHKSSKNDNYYGRD